MPSSFNRDSPNPASAPGGKTNVGIGLSKKYLPILSDNCESRVLWMDDPLGDLTKKEKLEKVLDDCQTGNPSSSIVREQVTFLTFADSVVSCCG